MITNRLELLAPPSLLIALLTLASSCNSDAEPQTVLGAAGNTGSAGAAAGNVGGGQQGGGTNGSSAADSVTAGSGGTPGAASGGNAGSAGASGTVAGSGGAGGAGGVGGYGGSAGSGGVGGAGGVGGYGGSAGSGGMGGSGGVGGATGFIDPGPEGDGESTVNDFSVPDGDLEGPQGSFSGEGRWGGDDVSINVTSDLLSGDHAVQIYIPDQYVNGTEAPFMIAADGLIDFLGGDILLDVVRKRIAADDERQVPPMVLIGVEPPDRNSRRSVEYDTMSDTYVRFINEDVIPAVLAHSWVTDKYDDFKLTSNPAGRGIYGCSSGGSVGMAMAWFGNFTRVLSFSGSMVSLQRTPPDFPDGAWSLPQVIMDSPVQEGLRVFLEVGGNDFQRGGTQDWIIGNSNLAQALAAKGYHYQLVTAAGKGHCDRQAISAILPDALTWLWRGYPTN